MSAFYVLGLSSLLLHWNVIGTSLWANTPAQKTSVYDILKNSVGKQDESNRFLTGLGNTAQKLKLISSHPVISATGGDVLFTMLSLCVWAFVRKLDVDDILDNSFLSFLSRSPKEEKHVSFEKKTDTIEANPAPASPRKRGRPRKNGTAPSTPSSQLHSASSTGSLRRSTRRRRADQDSDWEDSFEPSLQAAKEVKEAETDGAEAQEDFVHGGESAALALLLAFVGGLGPLAASILGAEATGHAAAGD